MSAAPDNADLAHLLAYFAVLHRGDAVLIDEHDDGSGGGGGWMLRVQTIAGPIAWPLRTADLVLFDRVARTDPHDPRAAGLADAVARRHERLALLVGATWNGFSAFTGGFSGTESGGQP